jgi:hypothetical protein
MKKIKLSEYCKINGITYRTGWNHFKAGKFGDKGTTNSKGGMFIEVEEITDKSLVSDLQAAIFELKSVSSQLLAQIIK